MERPRLIRTARLITDPRKAQGSFERSSRISAAPAATSTDPVSESRGPPRTPVAAPGPAIPPASAKPHDTELVSRFNNGDEEAFNEIVRRHRDKMFSIALRMLHNHADAEEVAQDTFIRAYRGLARFRGESTLGTWLHRIAVNLSYNRYWYFSRRQRSESRSFDCPLTPRDSTCFGDLIASENPDPAREAATREFTAHVAASMSLLPELQREILTLRNLRDHTYDEIAAMMHLSVGTVKSRISRARQHLREHLADTYVGIDSDDASSFPWFERSPPCGQLAMAAS